MLETIKRRRHPIILEPAEDATAIGALPLLLHAISNDRFHQRRIQREKLAEEAEEEFYCVRDQAFATLAIMVPTQGG